MKTFLLLSWLFFQTVDRVIEKREFEGNFNASNFQQTIQGHDLNINTSEIETKYSNPETLVLQILPEFKAHSIVINGISAVNITAYVFIPKQEQGLYISCPLNYFQKYSSLRGKWIFDDSSKVVKFEGIDSLKRVLITLKRNGEEVVINLHAEYSKRLLDYFNLDVYYDSINFLGFDCYAFISLLSNVNYFPRDPGYEFSLKKPQVGDIIALAENESLPGSIKHWALYLGNDIYLSKFGRSGEGAEALVTVMDLEGMKILYKSPFVYVATPKKGTKPWTGYPNLLP